MKNLDKFCVEVFVRFIFERDPGSESGMTGKGSSGWWGAPKAHIKIARSAS